MSGFDGASPEQEAWAEEASHLGRSPTPEQQRLCDECDEGAPQIANSTCLACPNVYYCDVCWAERRPHMRRNPKHQRVPIEGSTIRDLIPVFRRIDQVFHKDNATAAEEEQHQQHDHALEALWLAVASFDDGEGSALSFNERPRFGDLMGEHLKQHGDNNMMLYPRLISFVGNTGAGKSSLIEVLIGHLWDSEITEQDLNDTLVPVVGNRTTSLPTSSDIHLYFDRIEARTNPESPLLFADCEGFEAADHSTAAESRAKFMKNLGEKAPEAVRQNSSKLKKWTTNAFDTSMRFIKRTLSWLDSNTNRNEAIEELFPRLVYTISDVVVYVVAETNLTSMGKVLEKLVKWSQKAEMSSVNRTSLPSLVVLINLCDPAKNQEWSSEETTKQILKEHAYLMENNETIVNRKNELESYSLQIRSIKDILNNSYAAVKFLRIPTANDIPRLRSQIEELYSVIGRLTEITHEKRKENNMLLSHEQLQHLHQLAFDHFSQSTTSAFDYMEAFFRAHPSPAELSGNFFELLQATFEAIKSEKQISSHEPFITILIPAVVPVICSTIALHSRHRGVAGPLLDVLRGRGAPDFQLRGMGVQDNSYEKILQTALWEFSGSSLPCGMSIDEETRFCVNGSKSHASHSDAEGWHQDATGELLGSGPFDRAFVDRFEGAWAHHLTGTLQILESAELPGLRHFHRQAIRDLYNLVPNTDLRRLPSCVWCMQQFPTERLPCGHWICSTCVVGIGRRSEDDDRAFIIELCDQHPGGGEVLEPSFEFLDLPSNVGRRLLSLDDGGIRGIFQLKILADIQDELGKEIPLQDCFDLIGGTGIGGLTALLLGIGRRDVANAIVEFERLVPQALTKQSLQSGLFSRFFRSIDEFPYSRGNLEQSIRDAMGEHSTRPMTDSLLNISTSGSGPIRVFVTTTRKGSGGILLTNYRRKTEEVNQDGDQKLEGSQSDRERPKYAETFSVGDAAKATASFEPFFGPCVLNPGNHLHIGGAGDFACPSEATLLEAQSLWSHMQNGKPDVLVSLGCGHESSSNSGNSKYCTSAEVKWEKAFKDRVQKEPHRYIRLCPKFSMDNPLPKADDLSFLTKGSLLRDALSQEDLRCKVELVARRLISTMFYFVKTSSTPSDNGWTINGYVRCRLKEHSRMTKALGNRISSLKNLRFVSRSKDIWKFDESSLRVMTEQGRFRAPFDTGKSLEIWSPWEDEANIKLRGDEFPPESISGSLSR